MIYFLDNSLQLQKIVTSKNIISAIHEHELNGLIRADVELDLSYANKFLILGIDHVGYYYKDEFYLHKIQRVEYDHVNESAKVVLRHIFFEDMIFGKLIQDVRPQNQDALTVSRQTIDANTRWQTIMTDVTGRLSTNFYWQVPYEVVEFMTENYRIEYLPKILFDGKKINGFQLHLANKIGEDKNIRIPYGSRVLDLKYEEDYSEIITKLVVHGKGEEVGDGYGRRINISDVNFSRNGVKSPVGSLYLEDESITNTYGNDGQTPREGREVFEDIENVNELAEAGYQHYLQVSRPQMLFTADVADIGDVGIGDSVMIIRREYDVYFKARIHKLSVDLLYPEDAQVELGDYKHFKESKIARKTREKNDKLHKRNQSEIERLKRQFDENFNAEVEQLRQEFEQAKIDIFAEIEADRVRMEALLDTKLTEFDTAFNADMDAAYEEAQRNYAAIEGYVNTTVETNRNQVEQIINTAEQSAKDYAEQQAREKATAVRTDLEMVTSGHQQMIDDLESNVLNIDEYLGDVREIPLDQRLLDITQVFDERINGIREGNYNMIRGTSLDESSIIYLNGMDLVTDERLNYASAWLNAGFPYLRFLENITLEAGKQYTLSFDYRTDKVPEMDVVRIKRIDGTWYNIKDASNHDETNVYELIMDNTWRRAFIRFTPTENITGQLDIGTDYVAGSTVKGILDIRLPYLTQTGRTQWLFHPLDTTQNVEEVSRRLTQLEDGYKEMIVRSEWNAELNSINQTIRDYQTTVDGVEDTIIQLQDSEVITRGREVLDTVDGFQRKVWMGDFDRPNLIPHTTFNNRENRDNWGAWGRYGSTYGGVFQDYAIVGDSDSAGNIGIISPNIGEYIEAGKQYTLTWEASAHYPQTTSMYFQYMHLTNIGDTNYSHRLPNPTYEQIGTETNVVYRRYKLTFKAPVGINPNTQILFATNTLESNINAFFRFRHPKLEVGGVDSPFKTSFSMIEQRADEISLAVQGLDFTGMLTQSDIRIEPGYVQLGSQRLGDSQLASIFRVSPNSIQAITERMILNGDLYVDGDITALAVNAIEGNFARLFTAQVTAGSVHADYVQGFSARFSSLYTLNANIERLVSQTVFTNAITAKSVDAIVANIGRVRTAFLTANVIESDHIQVGTALVDKLFATSARIDELITKSHFVTNVKAMSIEAVEGNFSSLFTRYLSTNYIDAGYIVGKNAWFETMYTSNAMIRKLTAQTAFIRDVQAIEITANQLNLTTLRNRFNQIEGGLHITRAKDGVRWIENGVPRGNVPVQTYDSYAGSNIRFNGLNYITEYSHWQTFKYFYTPHEGRILRVVWAVGLLGSSGSSSEYVEVQVNGFGNNNQINNGGGSSSRRVFVSRGDTVNITQDIPLPPPNYNLMQAYLQVRRSPSGTGVNNEVFARILHIGQYG